MQPIVIWTVVQQKNLLLSFNCPKHQLTEGIYCRVLEEMKSEGLVLLKRLWMLSATTEFALGHVSTTGWQLHQLSWWRAFQPRNSRRIAGLIVAVKHLSPANLFLVSFRIQQHLKAEVHEGQVWNILEPKSSKAQERFSSSNCHGKRYLHNASVIHLRMWVRQLILLLTASVLPRKVTQWKCKLAVEIKIKSAMPEKCQDLWVKRRQRNGYSKGKKKHQEWPCQGTTWQRNMKNSDSWQ